MIWVVGAQGMLGRQLAGQLKDAGLRVLESDREVDVTESGAVERFHTGKAIDWIINCAAYTAVDKAEDEPDLCYAINCHGPEVLAVAASRMGARLIHVSTDYVFDGKGARPYLEDDPIGPVGVYAKSKAESENVVRRSCPRSIIIRTAWLYGAGGKNFPSTMLRLLSEKDVVRVVNDQRGSPTWTFDLARVISLLAGRDGNEFGTYHYTSDGEATWYELAQEIRTLALELGILSSSCGRIEPISTAQYPTRAVRPAYSVLSKEKIKRTFGIEIPHWKTSLRAFLEEIARKDVHPRREN